MNRKQRDNNRQTFRELRLKLPPTILCSNCGQLDYHGHFVPPGFGESGYFICPAQQVVKG